MGHLNGRRRRARGLAGILLLGLLLLPAVRAEQPYIVMASTTSTAQSGLFEHLLPAFTAATGITVRVVAVGTGQALDIGRRGDADVVFVHDTAAEEAFVTEGHARARHDVMVNEFVLLGPTTDPAGARGNDARRAFASLAAHDGVFVSRGDNSGTHLAELRLWRAAGVTDAPARLGRYRACGCGMGQALNMAATLDGYVLADRATWLAFANRGNLAVLVAGDPGLRNPYGVLAVDPVRHPGVRAEPARRFVEWVLSEAGQARIAAFRIGGEQAFRPTARPAAAVIPAGR